MIYFLIKIVSYFTKYEYYNILIISYENTHVNENTKKKTTHFEWKNKNFAVLCNLVLCHIVDDIKSAELNTTVDYNFPHVWL